MGRHEDAARKKLESELAIAKDKDAREARLVKLLHYLSLKDLEVLSYLVEEAIAKVYGGSRPKESGPSDKSGVDHDCG